MRTISWSLVWLMLFALSQSTGGSRVVHAQVSQPHISGDVLQQFDRALYFGQIGTVRKMLHDYPGIATQGCPIKIASENGGGPVYRAIIKMLLANGADINATDGANAAAINISHDVPFLLSLGADPNHHADAGDPPIFTYMPQGLMDRDDLPVTKALIAHGANVNFIDRQGNNLIHELIIKNTERDPDPTSSAAWHAQVLGMLKYYMAVGVDPAAPNADGNTPLMLVCHEERREFETKEKMDMLPLARALLTSKKVRLAINVKNKAGEAPLHCVYFGGRNLRVAWAKLLLANGANADIRDNQGRNLIFAIVDSTLTPAEQAYQLNLLLKYGANINAVDNTGQSILDEVFGRPRLIALLKQHGAHP